MSSPRALLTLLALMTSAGCGSAPGAAGAPIDEDRLARRVADILFARMSGEGADALPEGAATSAWPTRSNLPGADAPRLRVPVEGAPSRGAAEPLVTIVEFSDFECPFCSRVQPTLERLLETYPDDVRIVFRHNPLPFHQDAMPAAEAAVEAYRERGDAGFWEMHDLLFANQSDLGRPDLERYGQSIGLSPVGLASALDRHVHRAAIEADMALAARLGARGTPHFFINGRRLAGAQPFVEFETVVDEEIALAREAMLSGALRAALYASVLEVARNRPEPEPPPPNLPPSRPAGPPEDTVYHVPVGRSPARGPATAPVTIVEFADMQCPFCQRAQDTLRQVRAHYGQDVRIVWKHNPLPFHQEAMPAAIALEEARAQQGERGFWELHDRIFGDQEAMGRADLERHAQEMGLDLRRFGRALDGSTHAAIIQADQRLATDLGATGTPSFFINGRLLRGAQPYEAFTRLIDETLAVARERVRAGTPARRVYESLVRDGLRDAAAWHREHDEGGGTAGAGGTAEADTVYRIPVPPRAPTRGSRNAPVTIQIFSDFQCPFCTRARPTIDQLLNEYRGQIRLVWRNYPLPFHDNAQAAAEAAMEVFRQGGNDAFWAYHNLLFDNQQALSADDLERYAGQIGGIDMNAFRAAREQRRHRAAVEADMDAVRTAGARIGTPSFFVNGRLIQGAQPIEVFRTAVERALRGNR